MSGRSTGAGNGRLAFVSTFQGGRRGGLGGYVWPSATPASISAIRGMSYPAVAANSTTYTCNAIAITAGSATPGAATGGLGAGTAGAAAYTWCMSAGAAPTALGGVSANCASPTVLDAASLPLTATTISGAANTYSFTLQLNDLGNSSTPASAELGASAARVASPVINPQLVASVIQSRNAIAVAKLLDGVVNRSYGAVPTTLITPAPPIYSATGGLPTSSGGFLWCIGQGTLPPNLTGISATCGSSTSTASNNPQLSAGAAAPIDGTGGSYSFSVQADDGVNAAVPCTFVTPLRAALSVQPL